MSPRTLRFTFYACLVILALGAMVMLTISTPAGVGLANDSVAYIAGARSILSGTGYSDIWLDSSLEAITHYPPLLSLTLAAIGLLGVDPLRGARILDILLFGANTGLLGLLGWRMTRSQAAGVLLAILFAFNATLLHVSVFAMSEPLFLFLSLVSFLVFDFSLETRHTSIIARCSLLITGFFTGLAFLARYSALALLPTFAIALLLFQKTWRERLVTIGFFLTGAILPMAAWFIRNMLAADNVTNRTFQYHPILISNVRLGLHNFAQFILPIDAWQTALFQSGTTAFILILVGVGLLVWLLNHTIAAFFHPASGSPQMLAFTTALYVFSYLGAMLFSMSFFDASTKFQPRILAPIYVSWMVLFVGALSWLWKAKFFTIKSVTENLSRGVVIILTTLSLGLSAYGFIPAVASLQEAGQGYASWQWHDSLVMASLKNLPLDVAIYTNTPPAVYLVTGRASRVLPTPIDPVDDQPRGSYEQDVAQMRADLLSGKAVLALFDTSNLEDALGTQNVESFVAGLEVIQKAQGDILYGKP